MKRARKLGPSLSLVASLLMGAVAMPAALAAMGATVVGCADEGDPKTWVDRLKNPADRAAAIDKLYTDFYQKALNRAQGNREDPVVKGTLDTIVDPLTNAYIEMGGGEDATGKRRDLLKMLIDMKDPRASSAFVKALQNFNQDAKSNSAEEEVDGAIGGTVQLAKAGKLSDPKLIDALWETFAKYRASQQALYQPLPRDLHDAMLEVGRATKEQNPYGDRARDMIKRAIKLKDDGTPADPKNATDELYWQLTSVQILGDVKYTKAARELVTVLLDPVKQALGGHGELPGAAQAAIQKMPKETEPLLIAALSGSDPELKKLVDVPARDDKTGKILTYDKDTPEVGPDGKPVNDKSGRPIVHEKGSQRISKRDASAQMQTIAGAIATISRESGRAALLSALPTADAETKSAIVEALVAMPASDEAAKKQVKEAFLDAVKKIDKNDKRTRAAMFGTAMKLYDPAVVDFVYQQIKDLPKMEAKTDIEEKLSQDVDDQTIKGSALDTSLKLMTTDAQRRMVADLQAMLATAMKQTYDDQKKQIADSKKVDPKEKEKLNKDNEKDFKDGNEILATQSKVAIALLDDCKDNLDCYLKELDKPVPASPSGSNMRLTKAITMAVVLSDKPDEIAKTRSAFVAHMGKIKDPLARIAMADGVDELSPQGDKAAADAFDAVVEKDKSSGDQTLLKYDNVVARTALRLRGRLEK